MQKLTQPSHNTCIITCLAMLTNRAVDDPDLERIHELIWAGQPVEMEKVLTHLGVVHRPRLSRDTIEAGKCYMATVPSLNTPGSFHSILIDARNGVEILDPAEGYADKLFYTRLAGVPDGVVLTSWIVDFEVEPHDREHPYPTS